MTITQEITMTPRPEQDKLLPKDATNTTMPAPKLARKSRPPPSLFFKKDKKKPANAQIGTFDKLGQTDFERGFSEGGPVTTIKRPDLVLLQSRRGFNKKEMKLGFQHRPSETIIPIAKDAKTISQEGKMRELLAFTKAEKEIREEAKKRKRDQTEDDKEAGKQREQLKKKRRV
ncbi:hypothetical protein LTS17_012285 [Exophiala oligosperma]